MFLTRDERMGRNLRLCLLAVTFVLSQGAPLIGAPQQDAAAPQQDAESDELVQLSTSGPVPLSDLVEYASRRLGVTYLHDPALKEKQVNLIAPDPIPLSRLDEVLQNVLLAEGFIVSDPDITGVKRISTIDRLAEVARPGRAVIDLAGVGAAVPVTKLFELENTDATKAAEVIRPFLSQSGASIVVVENRNMIIVTDAAENVRRAAEFIQVLDAGDPLVEVRFVDVEHVAAQQLADQLRELLDAKLRVLGTTEAQASGVEVAINSRTNQLILVGKRIEIERAVDLLQSLDTELPTVQQPFSMEFITPERFDEVLRDLLAERQIPPPYQSRSEGNVLVIDSTREVLELASRVLRSLDTREAPMSQSPIRFYKIKNVPAQELVQTLQGVAGESVVPGRRELPPRRRTTNDAAVPGPNISPLVAPGAAQPVRIAPTPPDMREDIQPTRRDDFFGLDESGRDSEILPDLFEGAAARSRLPRNETAEPLQGNATVTVDVHTNTIIVVATPEIQRIYAALIEHLDQRRPQVLIEAKIVIIDTSNDYTLGVEVSGGDRSGTDRLFAFSSYGLSDVDPVTGALQILPGIGFNGTLVDPSTADVVVRAIANHRRARVLSTPRVLVNDNAEGQLTSVLEVPFTSVNASQTVATTSFAGFAEAGTTITVTPTISDDSYLQLEYVVTLNSFTGGGSEGVPPPRQTNEVRSRVTVPDGYTVIVGGLVSKNGSFDVSTIPWIEKIPVLRDLASLQSKADSETSLFVFLRPVILREDKFKDLKFYSSTALKKSQMPGNFPATLPLTIE